nr:amidohydrolase family protein [Treponemataceae bacterium]
MRTVFYNAHLVDENLDCDGAVLVQDGKIFAVVQGDFSDADSARSLSSVFGANEENCSASSCDGCKLSCELDFVNCNGKTLMPSFIDMHVHFRYPGQTQKEDLTSGLNAAVAGGFSTVVLMPNTNPVVSSDELAHSIESEAAVQNKARVIQSVSLTKDFDGKTTDHIDDLSEIILMTEDGHDVQDSLVMLEAMSKAAVKGAIVACHCEDESFNAQARSLRKQALEQYAAAGEQDHDESAKLAKLQAETFMEDANELLALAEDGATERNIHLAQDAGCKIHLCHVSTAKSLAAVQRAWDEKSEFSKNVTCEVTPHHFGLDVTGNRENLKYIVNPPIRSALDREALIKELCNESN